MATIPRVYALANNPITSLLAYEIAQLPAQPKVPQVVLLLNDMKKLSRFLENDSKLTIQKDDDKDYHHSQFMASHLPPVYSAGGVATIPNAIFSGPHTRGLVQSIKKYNASFSDQTNLLLVNPPFGSIDYLYRNVWQTKEARPNLLIGITSQKGIDSVTSTHEFRISVTGQDLTMRISPIPRDLFDYEEQPDFEEVQGMRDNDLVKLMEATTHNQNKILPLDLLLYSFGELLLIRLEKLIIESCIEPLAALYDCQYRQELLNVSNSRGLINEMVKEQVFVLKCAYPFLAHISGANTALDPERLLYAIIRELEHGDGEISRMRLSMEQLQRTNINELTGYFVRIANYRKVDCSVTKSITNLVMGKAALLRRRALDYKLL